MSRRAAGVYLRFLLKYTEGGVILGCQAEFVIRIQDGVSRC
jgi:hypothetical protein